MDLDPRYRRAQAESIHRSFGMILVVILLIVAAALWVQSRINRRRPRPQSPPSRANSEFRPAGQV
jgi:hypothetical protein